MSSDDDDDNGSDVELMDLEDVPHVKSESTFERQAAETNTNVNNDTLLGCTRSKVVGFAREAKEKGQLPFSNNALDYMSVGHFEAAIDQSYDDGDPITWAASMCLAGYPGRAREALESLVAVAVSRIANDASDPLSPRTKDDVIHSPLQGLDSSPNPTAPTPRSSGVLYSKVNDLVDRLRITRWYYVCLCLDSAFDLPERAVVREYFRLSHPKAAEELRNAGTAAQRRRVADGLILRQLSGTQVTFAKVVVSWQLGRYRTALQQTGLYMGAGGDTTDSDDVLIRFIRLMCHLKLGSFSAAAEDADFFNKRCASPFVKAVGSCIRAAISQKQELLAPAAKLPPSLARYCYFIAFHVQSLAFVMRGHFDRADESFEAIIAHGPRSAYWIAQHFDLEASANIAAKETKRLRSNLCSKVGQAHVWLSRYYGVTDMERRADEIIAFCLFEPPREFHRAGHPFDVKRAQAAKSQAEAARRALSTSGPDADASGVHAVVVVSNNSGDAKRSLGAPSCDAAVCDPLYVDVRLLITVNVVRALVAFRGGNIALAWQAINEAAVAADDLLGTCELCCSAGSPVRVLTALVNIGLLLIASGKHPERNAEVLNRVKDVKQTLQECFPEHILSSAAHACIFLAQEDAGEATIVAKKMLNRFPQSLYALGLLSASYALDGRLDPAQVVATTACSNFPHSDTARLIYKAAYQGENYALLYYYRGVLPVPLVDGQVLRHVLRTLLVGLLILVHVLLFCAVLGINAYIVIQGDSIPPTALSSAAKELAFAWRYLTLEYRLWPAYIPFGVGLFYLVFLLIPITVSPSSHVGLSLHTLRFRNTAGVRFLWTMRTIMLCNAATAAMQYAFHDQKVVDNISTTTMSSTHQLIALALFGASCLPATTRFLYMRSMDEPEMWLPRWIAVLLVDLVCFVVFIVPHVILVVLEPFIALAHVFAHDGDRPFNLSTPAKLYCGFMSLLFKGTQSSASTTTAALEEDMGVDLKVFPLVKSTNAGTPGFMLVLPEEQDLRLRNGAEARSKEKNSRTLNSVAEQKRDVIAKRGVLAGIASVGADNQMNGTGDDDAKPLTLEITGPTVVFDPFAVEMAIRKVPHSNDERLTLVKDTREGFWYYFVALFDSHDADLYSQLAVPEVIVSLDRSFDLDPLSFAYCLDALIRLESGGRKSLLLLQQSNASPNMPGLSASPIVFSSVSLIEGGGSGASVGRLSFRSSSRTNSSRAGSRQSMHNRRSSLNDTSSTVRTSLSRDSVSPQTNPLSARQSPTPPAAAVVVKPQLSRGGSFGATQTLSGGAAAIIPKLTTEVSGSTFTRARSTSGKRTEPKDPVVSFANAIQGYADVPSQDDDGGKNSTLLAPQSNRSRASSVASSATGRSRSASSMHQQPSAMGSTQTSVSTERTDASDGTQRMLRGETFSGTTNGDVFAKLLAERQAQAAASLKSPFLDPNEFVLRLPDADAPIADQTSFISGKVSDIRRVLSTLESRIAKGTTEADIQAIQTLEKSLGTMKHSLSMDLTTMPKSVTLTGKIVTEQFLDLIDTLIKSPEANNTSLVSQILAKFAVGMKLGDAAYQRGWVHAAVRDGKPRYLCYLLQLPNICDTIGKKPGEILLAAGKHERARIPLCQVLLRFAIPLGLHKRKSELEAFWSEVVLDNIANVRKLNGSEDQTGRLALVQYLCTTPDVVRVNHERHRKDGLNVFLRACRDGDVDVVDLLLSKGLVTDVNERAKDRDGSTALVLAAMGGHKAVVESLLKTGRVDVLLKVKDKTAYVLAQENFKNPLLIALLRKAQQDAESTSKKTTAQARAGAVVPPAAVVQDPAASLELTNRAPLQIAKPDTPPDLIHDSSPAAQLAMANTPAGRMTPQDVINLFRALNAQYQRLDMGGDDVVLIALIRLRQDVAARLARDGTVAVPALVKLELIEVLDRIVENGDSHVGGPELLRAAALHLDPATFDFKAAAEDREWPLMAARNSSPVMLGIVLAAMGELSEQTASNVIIAASKCDARLDVAKTLLDHSRSWRKLRVTLAPLWQQFFENVGFAAGASQHEEPSRRFALLDRMLKHRDIEIQFETEASDGYTLFARACAHGDAEFVQFMIDRHVLEDPNKMLSDGTNPLLQAVAGDHVEVVETLVRSKLVDCATFLPGIGTALDVATKLKRHHRIVDCLRSAVGLPSAHRADGNSGHQMARRGSMRQ